MKKHVVMVAVVLAVLALAAAFAYAYACEKPPKPECPEGQITVQEAQWIDGTPAVYACPASDSAYTSYNPAKPCKRTFYWHGIPYKKYADKVLVTPATDGYWTQPVCELPPEPVCEDPLANNVGGPLPCTYDPPPPQLCEDPEANNVGQPLPCTYDEPPVLCEDEAALNYGEEGECEYAPPPPPPPLREEPECKWKGTGVAVYELWSGAKRTGDYALMYVYDFGDGFPKGVSVERQECVLGWTAKTDSGPWEIDRNTCTGQLRWHGLKFTPDPKVVREKTCDRSKPCLQ